MNSEIWILIRNLIVTALIIALFLFPLGLVAHIYRKRALAMVHNCSAEVRDILKDSQNRTQAQVAARIKYIRKSLILGILALVLIIGYSFLGNIADGNIMDNKFFLGFSVFLLFVIALLITRDFCRVAPWLTAYRIKALVCISDRNGGFYVAFYDFLNMKFSSGHIALPMTKRSQVRKGEIIDLVAVKRNGKLHALDIM